jgi:hypothetical protein
MRLKLPAMLALAFAFLLIVAALAPFPAYAQDDTTITIPWGDWLSSAIGVVGMFIIGVVVPALLAWVLSMLPAPIRAWFDQQRIAQVEQLLGRAVDYGLNAVDGAVKGKELSVPVGSAVVAEAAQYAIDHGPSKIIEWLGGPEAVKEMILARLPLQANATARDVLDNAPPVRGE